MRMPINRPETAQISTIAYQLDNHTTRCEIVELRAVKTHLHRLESGEVKSME